MAGSSRKMLAISLRSVTPLLFLFLLTGCATLTKTTDHALNSELGKRIVSIARQYEGTAYKHGGSTPNGFDCSGFT